MPSAKYSAILFRNVRTETGEAVVMTLTQFSRLSFQGDDDVFERAVELRRRRPPAKTLHMRLDPQNRFSLRGLSRAARFP
jgi:hypothetical protein